MPIEGDRFAACFYKRIAFDDDAFGAVFLRAQAAVADTCNAFAREAGCFACRDDLTTSIGAVSQTNDASHRFSSHLREKGLAPFFLCDHAALIDGSGGLTMTMLAIPLGRRLTVALAPPSL